MNEKDNKNQQQNIIHEKLIEYIDLINIQFREPASGIFASLPLIANNISNNNAEKALDNLYYVHQNTYMILRSINNMSVTAKLMGGKTFSREVIDFSNMVKSIYSASDMILPGYFKADTEIDDGCYIYGNNALLSVGLLNILLNSFDYRQDDDVKISVQLKREKGRSVLIYKDNSIGIKPEIAEAVFNPFFTANPYCDGESGMKMGVGLYIAQQAVKHAGGTMLLQTEFSEGVCYVISIPDSITACDNVLKSSTKDYLLNRYSDVFVQLAEYCNLPDL